MATNIPKRPDERLYPVTWDKVNEAELDDALSAAPAQCLAWLEDALGLASLVGAIKRETAMQRAIGPGHVSPWYCMT